MKHWYDWKDVAADAHRWMKEADEFATFRDILYKVARFVSQIVHNFVLFAPVRALKGAAFSACEPHSLTHSHPVA